MNELYFLLVIGIVAGAAAKDEDPATTTPEPPQPVYKTPQQTPAYAPQNYPYSDSYAFFYPSMLPAQPQAYSGQQAQSSYVPAVIPAAQGALQVVLKVLAKFGLFVLGGTALLVIGGIFTTILCHLTPICVISFPAFGGLDKESVRSLMTPDKISAAAALVQDALGKYQRLQRATKT
ncbi:uncharacterized protein LOC108918023 [Anoplophora glabripennis]|uniref:uncharacterized protein LOC108918023 n=1 Tax=Anoplophora glabripennis TaxID=217634 RepID=UPI000874F08F|nr:uncharacterized protein LOC108918023 [Anoplophora glabripennis]